METSRDAAGTEKKKRHFSNGWFVWFVPLTERRCLQVKQVSGDTGGAAVVSGPMQEALGSDALRGGAAPLCHQDGLLPHLQDV